MNNQQQRVTYNNSPAVMARVVAINPLPESMYNGQPQKRLEVTLQIDNPDPQQQQRLTMLVGGRLAELPINIGDVKIWSFNFKGKEYNGRNYNNLYCWRINSMDGGMAYPVQQQTPQTPQTPYNAPTPSLSNTSQGNSDFDF